MKVIKIGGGTLERLEEFEEISEADIIVHGGSDYVDDLMRETGKKIRKIESLSGVKFRYTKKEDMDYFVMAMMKANKKVVRYLQSQDIDAVGLSGLDSRIIKGERKKFLKARVEGKKKVIRDDQSGRITDIDTDSIAEIEKVGLPVIAPIAIGEDFEPLNIDGDKLAYNISKEFEADELVFLSETAFLKDDEVVKNIESEDLKDYKRHAEGGMERKLIAAERSLQQDLGSLKIVGLNGTTVIR